jgi:Ca2+-binding RTX toxin-like protein
MDTIIGGGADGRLRGGDAGDVLSGGDGDQRIEAGAGDDYLAGGEGNDTLAGGAGADLLDGGYGDDASDAGEGDDFVWLFEGEDRVTLGPGADTLGIELAETGAEDRYGIGATVVADFDPAEDRIALGVSGVDAAGEEVEVDPLAGFLDSDGDGLLNAADEAVYGSEGGIVLDLGLALSRALGRDDIEPHVQTVRLLGVEELDLERNVAPLGEAYGGFAASHEDLLAAAADAGVIEVA